MATDGVNIQATEQTEESGANSSFGTAAAAGVAALFAWF